MTAMRAGHPAPCRRPPMVARASGTSLPGATRFPHSLACTLLLVFMCRSCICVLWLVLVPLSAPRRPLLSPHTDARATGMAPRIELTRKGQCTHPQCGAELDGR